MVVPFGQQGDVASCWAVADRWWLEEMALMKDTPSLHSTGMGRPFALAHQHADSMEELQMMRHRRQPDALRCFHHLST